MNSIFIDDITNQFSIQGTIEFVIILAVCSIIPVFIYLFTKRKVSLILSIVLSIITVIVSIFSFDILVTLAIVAYGVFLSVDIIANISFVKPLLMRRFEGKKENIKKLKKDKEIAKIYDKGETISIIREAVENFSRTKTGALITFEKHDNLKPLMKNGIILNAPLRVELIETIFYKGTRLHDGAMIIKEDKIIAASVYYNLTTRPLNGSYGTRHRAAIGISENSDSITVVVSEETGRISIAKDGHLEPVSLDNFERIFAEYIEEDSGE